MYESSKLNDGRTDVKKNASEEKLGWLEEDMKRAARQVAQWKIKKFDDADDDLENVESDSTCRDTESQDTLSC